MKVKTTLTEKEIDNLAKSLGMRLNNFRTVKNGFCFTLKPLTDCQYKGKGYVNKYNGSVCLHGYTRFMLELLKRDNHAIFITAFGKVTKQNIKEMYDTLCYRNVGSLLNIIHFGEKCYCSSEIKNNLYNSLKQI